MNERGSGWVMAQFVLMAAVVAAGFVPPDWPGEGRAVRIGVGVGLIAAGAGFAVWASHVLGRALTPFPRPNRAGLATGGPFALVRHPIYLGLLGVFGGYSLLASIAALVLTAGLALLWVGKTRGEERMLAEVYVEYAAYRTRVRWRLLPFVY